MLFLWVRLSHYCEFKNMRFPFNLFSIIVRPPLCTARCVLCCANISYFILGSVTIDQRLNAASKKENNTEAMSIHFLIRCFLKNDPLPLGS